MTVAVRDLKQSCSVSCNLRLSLFAPVFGGWRVVFTSAIGNYTSRVDSVNTRDVCTDREVLMPDVMCERMRFYHLNCAGVMRVSFSAYGVGAADISTTRLIVMLDSLGDSCIRVGPNMNLCRHTFRKLPISPKEFPLILQAS